MRRLIREVIVLRRTLGKNPEISGESEDVPYGFCLVRRDVLVAVRRGPSGARIDHVSEDWSEATGEYDGFAIEF